MSKDSTLRDLAHAFNKGLDAIDPVFQRASKQVNDAMLEARGRYEREKERLEQEHEERSEEFDNDW